VLVPFVRAFIAGFLSTLVFHQGVPTLFWLSSALPRAVYDMAPAPPLGVPAVMERPELFEMFAVTRITRRVGGVVGRALLAW
jgi:hypothetical protein